MLGPAGDKMIQILLPVGLLPLTLCFWVTNCPLPMLARVLLWLPALSLPSAWREFLCVSGSVSPAVTDGNGIPALAYLQLYTFRLVGACYPLPVFQTLFHHQHVMHVFQHVSPTAEPHTVFSTPVVPAVIINPGA